MEWRIAVTGRADLPLLRNQGKPGRVAEAAVSVGSGAGAAEDAVPQLRHDLGLPATLAADWPLRRLVLLLFLLLSHARVLTSEYSHGKPQLGCPRPSLFPVFPAHWWSSPRPRC